MRSPKTDIDPIDKASPPDLETQWRTFKVLCEVLGDDVSGIRMSALKLGLDLVALRQHRDILTPAA